MSRCGRLRLRCRGVVQGVGFRPAVHRLASRLGLSGSVANVAGAVRIELEGEIPRLEKFVSALPGALPAAARLDALETTWLPASPASHPNGVRIVSEPPRPLGVGLVAAALAADRAPCPACLAELEDPADRRFGYPFISCSVCGPRYSIATAEPYARAHTTLAAFPLCPACRREFEDPADRRFHAETIACPACGPRLALLDGRGRPAAGDPLVAACGLLRSGGILALQGVGGFQLLVDAADPAAVARLRRRKRRPAKPFALLVADPAWIEPHVRIDAAERALLASPAAPIVLLRRRQGDGECFAGVAPGSAALGVMLPASPLHHLLARRFAGPLVATSGNPSGEPLCTAVAEAVERLGAEAPVPVADAFLVHDRPIARPLDDSVAQVIEGRPVLLRRARGHAPEPLRPPAAAASAKDPARWGAGAVVALGGDLKGAPALARDGRIWLAPHLGDLARARVFERLRSGLAELVAEQGAALEALACDGHPGYLSHQLVAGDARAVAVPHHLAHGLAVMAEHGLEPPLAVIALDGLGFGAGSGHRLWGGEVLRIEADGWRRHAGLRPFPLPGGERAMAEPRRAALGLLAAARGTEAAFTHPGSRHCRDAFDPAEPALLLRAVAGGCNAPLCSSAGRLFDAAASLLGLVQVLSHEGEAGLLLEGLATGSEAAGLDAGAYRLPLCCCGDGEAALLDWRPLLTALLDDIAADTSAAVCAARFHWAVAEGFATAAQAALGQDGPRRVALGGGCFQNRLLLQESIAALRRRGLEPFWNEQVPGSDGGLALGQVWGASHPALLPFRPLSGPQPAPITEEETHRRGATAHVSGRRRSHPRDRGSAPRRGG